MQNRSVVVVDGLGGFVRNFKHKERKMKGLGLDQPFAFELSAGLSVQMSNSMRLGSGQNVECFFDAIEKMLKNGRCQPGHGVPRLFHFFRD
jgi:hypothetical protein